MQEALVSQVLPLSLFLDADLDHQSGGAGSRALRLGLHYAVGLHVLCLLLLRRSPEATGPSRRALRHGARSGMSDQVHGRVGVWQGWWALRGRVQLGVHVMNTKFLIFDLEDSMSVERRCKQWFTHSAH